ncbi:hypothetical protein BO221_08060 [Archangium sp. Cb G35]|uniref:3-keto-disaccharide hydrolase n=1 Tax=Archangium sp. Cb G35 TaxID=1920190 RepID=UPI0009376617|nr:DUF1080 domain-containing protein [Archangium sp. Cb G35]OJT25796.1 hypothetical protein BO221_08060 [Archangium sp. Cb G35]
MDSFQTLSFDTPGTWAMAGEGRFVPAGPGLLESEGGSGLLWYTPSEFSDFRLQVDWLAHSLEDNSGVFFRFPTAELARKQPDWKAGFEVQIDDRGVDPEHETLGSPRMGSPLHLTGALYTLAPALRMASRPLGEWNSFDILARGLELRVVLNGVEVCVFTAPVHKPRSGRIGLQAHHAGSRVCFRAPRIQRLT